MAKKSKLQTPDWILKGGKAPSKKKTSSKTFKIKVCPKCGSERVSVVLNGEEGSDEDELLATSSKRGQSKGTGEWECKKCGWIGRDVKEKELSEDEFLELMEKKGANKI
ncbi:MAG: hypothetical protein AABW51_04540 [Nanoarchaeota archaeon]